MESNSTNVMVFPLIIGINLLWVNHREIRFIRMNLRIIHGTPITQWRGHVCIDPTVLPMYDRRQRGLLGYRELSRSAIGALKTSREMHGTCVVVCQKGVGM
jgi:hypothetical protein